jgi:hypothetical protein
MELVTQKELRELYNYNPASGEFTFKTGSKKGDPVGTYRKDGYLVVAINKRQYYLHRLAWCWWHGYHPVGFCVDHKDGKRSNNRLANLRLASRALNHQNCYKPFKNNVTSKTLGVYKAGKKWIARIAYNHKQYNLGTFKTIPEAQDQYKSAKGYLHEFGNLENFT